MKIAFITTMAGHAWGGSEELWLKLANDALKENHHVECSVFNWGKLPVKTKLLKEAGARIRTRFRFIYPQLYKKPWGKLIEYTFAPKQLLNHLNATDFALVSMGAFCDLEVDAFRKPLLKTETPYSIVIHANPETTYLKTEKITEIINACQKAQKIYFVSDRLKEIAIRQTGYTFPNSSLIINPVNMKEIGTLPYPNDEVVQFASVGLLSAKVKGQAILLQCLADNLWKGRNWHLNIYGKGNDLDYLIMLAKNFNIKERVSFHGYVNDIRNDIWGNNHILLMPSYYEGMPIALMEAMLSGRTAVVTDVGGNSEIIEDNITGFIAKAANKKSFQEALERAWQIKQRWQEMGENSYKSCYNYLHKPSSANYLNDILDELPFN